METTLLSLLVGKVLQLIQPTRALFLSLRAHHFIPGWWQTSECFVASRCVLEDSAIMTVEHLIIEVLDLYLLST